MIFCTLRPSRSENSRSAFRRSRSSRMVSAYVLPSPIAAATFSAGPDFAEKLVRVVFDVLATSEGLSYVGE